MSFLQPWMLAALPLIALPIIIHLINQRRFQTIRWAAMMFLLAANRMSRGYAKLWQWHILAVRTLAVAGLVFAVCRPLAGGWMGLLGGGRIDGTFVLLDRSPSMQQQSEGGGLSKLETARRQLLQTFQLLNSAHWLLVESASRIPAEMESAAELEKHPEAEGAGSSADIPEMLLATCKHLKDQRYGRSDIWLASDLRQHDWQPESGRWETIRASFREFPQAPRIHLLSYADASATDRSIRVTQHRRRETREGAELLISLKVEQNQRSEEPVSVPVQIEIEGARTETSVTVEGTIGELREYSIPLERSKERGWGRVVLAADANPANNEFFFVFDRTPPRKTLIVSNDAANTAPLELATSISSDPGVTCEVEVLDVDQLATCDWSGFALVLWLEPLPTGPLAKLVESFLNREGRVLFFPPAKPTDDQFAGISWKQWHEPVDGISVATWLGDQDLLARARSGAALPVGQLRVNKYCEIQGEATPLATLANGVPLIIRSIERQRHLYFCGTTPDRSASTLATDGIVLYVALQRALAAGAANLGLAQQRTAGESSSSGNNHSTIGWQRLAGQAKSSSSYSYQPGVYAAGEKLIAINRDEAEDQPGQVSDEKLAELFDGLSFHRVREQAGSGSSLIREIWRVFLFLMMLALVAEAVLCLPKPQKAALATESSPPTGVAA